MTFVSPKKTNGTSVKPINEQNFTSANAAIEKSTHRLFITSIIALVYGILFMALTIYALNNMSFFSVGLDYYLLPDSAKMLIHFIVCLPAILYIIDGLLGIWVKNHPDKVMILLILLIITAVIIVVTGSAP